MSTANDVDSASDSYKETVFCIGGVLKGGGFVLGAGRKKHCVLLALVLLLLTPFAATSASLILDERKMTASNSISDFTPAQLEERGPIIIQNDADFVNYGFPGNGTESNPFVIEGLNISSEEASCISISNVIVSFVLRNCILRNAQALNPVIWLLFVHNSTIEDNIIIGGSEGILGLQTSKFAIRGNTICDSTHGLRFSNSLNITVLGNSIYRNSIGVDLDSTSQCFFSTNRIYANRRFAAAGFRVDETSDFNTFTSNLVGWNYWGIVSNNAMDDGSNNTWFGNSWSDYSSPGPYNISGESYSQDILPSLLVDMEAPWIIAPEDIVMGEGSPVNISWRPRDAFPLEYSLHINAQSINEGTWIYDEFGFNLQNLEPGDYDIILSVTDGSGNSTEDIVFVSVLYVILGDIGTELVAYASALSVVGLLMVLCLFKRRS
ncbi:MAG: NosD domain-containing protein [Candidatus Thorarchaeota archaeon]|jgi:parallel beta-helix repeat protein